MAALRSTRGHYIFAPWFLSFHLSIFFPRLISAAADWMSTGSQPNFALRLAVSWPGTLYIHFRDLLPPDGILPRILPHF